MTPPAPIQYRFERADLWHLTRAIYRPSWTKRLLPPLAVLVGLVSMIVYKLGAWPSTRQWAVLLRPELAVPTLGLVLLWANLHWFSILALLARFRSLAIAEKTVAISFSEAGLDADVEGMASHIPWRSFKGRIDMPDRVLLKLARWEAATVPRRAFADDASWQAALAFLREKVPHGQA